MSLFQAVLDRNRREFICYLLQIAHKQVLRPIASYLLCSCKQYRLQKNRHYVGFAISTDYSKELSIMQNVPSKALVSRRDSLCDGNPLRDENVRVSRSEPFRFKYRHYSKTNDENLSGGYSSERYAPSPNHFEFKPVHTIPNNSNHNSSRREDDHENT